MTGTFEFPAQEWKDTSPEAKAFIKRLLNLNADARPSAAEAMADPW
jgi:serine/threonine protein kinase